MKFKTTILLLICGFNALLFLAFDQSTSMPDLGEAPGTIEFIGDAGSPNKMYFEKWNFTEASMADDQIENLHLVATIDISSIKGDWKDLVKSIKKKKDYFNVADFPTAQVEVKGAEKQADGSYNSEVMLTLKKFTKPVLVNFTMTEEKPYVVEGTAEITRKKFGFTGKGPKPTVPVTFMATLPFE
ncbi:MAG: YceI family protein [Bacteroidota bacterium]